MPGAYAAPTPGEEALIEQRAAELWARRSDIPWLQAGPGWRTEFRIMAAAELKLRFPMNEPLFARVDYHPADFPPAPLPFESFGRWLLAQRDRGDWIDVLAAAARGDRDFPRNGSADEVEARLRALGADGDAFEQLADAERCWLSI